MTFRHDTSVLQASLTSQSLCFRRPWLVVTNSRQLEVNAIHMLVWCNVTNVPDYNSCRYNAQRSHKLWIDLVFWWLCPRKAVTSDRQNILAAGEKLVSAFSDSLAEHIKKAQGQLRKVHDYKNAWRVPRICRRKLGSRFKLLDTGSCIEVAPPSLPCLLLRFFFVHQHQQGSSRLTRLCNPLQHKYREGSNACKQITYHVMSTYRRQKQPPFFPET